MKQKDDLFNTQETTQKDLLTVEAKGDYTLVKANNLFKLAIDSCLQQACRKILIGVTKVAGSIPFLDRFTFAEYLANYSIQNGRGKISKIAVLGNEPVVDKDRFGEIVATNRGLNLRVVTDMQEALHWLGEP